MLLQAEIITTYLTHQSPVIVVLGLIVWYFYNLDKSRQIELQTMRTQHDADIKASSDKLEAYMTQDRELLLTALNNNTEALKDFQKSVNEHKLQ